MKFSRPVRIPATQQDCAKDHAAHTPQREADATTQKVEAKASGADKGRTWRGRR